MLTTNKLIIRLPVSFAQLKARNISNKLKNQTIKPDRSDIFCINIIKSPKSHYNNGSLY